MLNKTDYTLSLTKQNKFSLSNACLKLVVNTGIIVFLMTSLLFSYDETPTVIPTITQTPVIFNIVKSISTHIAVFGSTITYTISYTNPNADTIPEITIYDSIPAITDFIDSDSGGVTDGGTPNVVSWLLTDIPSGGTGAVTFRVKVARYP